MASEEETSIQVCVRVRQRHVYAATGVARIMHCVWDRSARPNPVPPSSAWPALVTKNSR